MSIKINQDNNISPVAQAGETDKVHSSSQRTNIHLSTLSSQEAGCIESIRLILQGVFDLFLWPFRQLATLFTGENVEADHAFSKEFLEALNTDIKAAFRQIERFPAVDYYLTGIAQKNENADYVRRAKEEFAALPRRFQNLLIACIHGCNGKKYDAETQPLEILKAVDEIKNKKPKLLEVLESIYLCQELSHLLQAAKREVSDSWEMNRKIDHAISDSLGFALNTRHSEKERFGVLVDSKTEIEFSFYSSTSYSKEAFKAFLDEQDAKLLKTLGKKEKEKDLLIKESRTWGTYLFGKEAWDSSKK